MEKEKEKRIRLKELGIDYEFAGYQGLVEAAAVDTKSKKSTKIVSNDSGEKVEKKKKKSKSKK